jgi:hypothetical protein
MSLSTISTLVLIGIVAVVSPVLAELTGRLAVPGVVFEIALGILIGPAVLGLAAGVLSVLLYPTLAKMRLRRTSRTHRPPPVQGKPAVGQAREG